MANKACENRVVESCVSANTDEDRERMMGCWKGASQLWLSYRNSTYEYIKSFLFIVIIKKEISLIDYNKLEPILFMSIRSTQKRQTLGTTLASSKVNAYLMVDTRKKIFTM